MLKIKCLNPQLIMALAHCGHGDKILICDGNYPIDSCTSETTEKVYLQLTHGIPTVTDVLKVLVESINIERAQVMTPGEGEEPTIFNEFREILSNEIQLDELGRFEFYDESKENNIRLAIATGEKRIFANILLTVGVV
ncbi:L-fucose mutarotase [Clostridium tetani]|uniref:RbsD/FucU family protein n=1 Tax=Clostridium tetani TaxID=1513 RepID=UPI000D213859|nr:RbsD/FucU family protein [Clostridium tetani]AVP55083.1 RbsD or FucU transport [Clostridium tetani]RXI52598.1 RbsD or FucU transport [Clostridium tetani]RXI56836.1 RbsD or FucU transport [Clostridium tetani]RXI74497.1 RbsD or FucU transport [Clostridium tetani]RXM69241.1 RbsD or FucU transport [Clostridium tetani]